MCPLGRTFFYIFGAKNYEGKGRFSLPNRGGGGSFCTLSIYQPALLYFQTVSSSLRNTTRTKGHRNMAKMGKSKHLFACFCLTSGISETRNGKSEIYFGFWGLYGFRCGSLFGAVVVSTGCRWCRLRGLPLVLGCVFLPFVLPPCFALRLLSCFAFQMCFISHFKGVVTRFWGVGVCLYGLRGLR